LQFITLVIDSVLCSNSEFIRFITDCLSVRKTDYTT